MRLSIGLEQEDDGRWIAKLPDLPGVMVYGNTPDEAIGNVERLAVDVVSDRIAHGELPPSCFNMSFAVPNEYLARI